MMRFAAKCVAGLLLTLCLGVLAGCGTSEAPNGSIITITPAGATLEDGTGVQNLNIERFYVVVVDENGSARDNVRVTFTMLGDVPDWSVATFRTSKFGTDLVGPLTLITDENGTIDLWIAYLSGLQSYKFNLVATSGTASTSESIEVKLP